MIELSFSNPADYDIEPGLEVVSGVLRLSNPTDGVARSAILPLAPNTAVILSAEADYTGANEPLVALFVGYKPTFNEAKAAESFPIGDLWANAAGISGDNIYVCLTLGGRKPESRRSLPFGPIGFWPFDESDARDSLDSGIDGLMSGISFRGGVLGNRAYFSGAGSNISFAGYDELCINTGQSIRLLLCPESIGSRRSVVHKCVGGEVSIVIEANGTLTYYYGTSGTGQAPYQGVNSVQAVSVGVETEVCVVRDLDNMRIKWYIDGVMTNTATALFEFSASTVDPLIVGNGAYGAFIGTIDELGIYDKALSASEVAELTHSGGFRQTILVSKGQMTVSSIRMFVMNSWQPGNVVAERVFVYRGTDALDSRVRLPPIQELTAGFSNMSMSADRRSMGYMIADSRAEYLDVFIHPGQDRENLIMHLNDSFDSDWSANGLVGCALDFKTCKGVEGHKVYRTGSAVRLEPGSYVRGSSDGLGSSMTFFMSLSKMSLSDMDSIEATIDIGGLKIPFVIDDQVSTMYCMDATVVKPDMPWTSRHIPVSITMSDRDMQMFIFGTRVYSGPGRPLSADVMLSCVRGDVELHSLYYGPLVDGIVNEHRAERTHVACGQIKCSGSMYMVGSGNMEAIGHVYQMAEHIYLDADLYAEAPGIVMQRSLLVGMRDARTSEEMLFFGSKEEYGIYRYRRGYWSLYLNNARLHGIWRSRHTEGLLVQKSGESSVKIHLLKRGDDGSLEFDHDISFIGLPSEDYEFDPGYDRRTSKKTCPWVWARDKSLNGV